jgi:NADPH-dependent 2,4-dienoyl-CoA reductase/sulfur reductase-like enzyme
MVVTRYLVVGGGVCGDAACRGILEVDPNPAAVTLVADEHHPPYTRPPLSKALWKGDAESTIFRLTANLGIYERLGRRIVALDLDTHTAIDDRGERYAYEKVLLATGGRPRRLPFGGDDIIYFRTLTDYHRLRLLADEGARVVVIGGGFIGSETAAALALHACPVTMVFPEPGIGARVFPSAVSAALVDYYRSCGIEVLPGTSVAGVEPGRVLLDDGRALEAEAIVAGVGIEPNVELAAAAGLPVSDGIVVDALGRVGGREDVFAAGDVARFPFAALGVEMRVEHADHAKTHGRTVGRNMAGADDPYEHVPFFYSDLFDLGYEAVGDLSARLETLGEPESVHDEGVVYYVDRARRPRGVLLWNVYGRRDDARALLAAGEPVALGDRPAALSRRER